MHIYRDDLFFIIIIIYFITFFFSHYYQGGINTGSMLIELKDAISCCFFEILFSS